ncbi:beta-ketoacyl-ACP synthase III [Oscillospiraceae bacterium MB08-C2-2]|nr:beta-ketoacyl-ACP synthase III [Oscillospiraceae bacterium MB08-C2-2]
MTGLKILGTGSYVPDFVVTNEDFAKLVDTSDEWITTRTGMKERHIAVHEPVWYMGAQAAKSALETAGITADQVDMVIVTSASADYDFPSVSNMVQNAVEANNAFGIDINVACSGIAYGLDMAWRYLMTGDVDTVLLVSAERLSQVTDYTDRATCVLFGDGAGASVVTRADNKAFASFLGSDSRGAQHMYCVPPQKPVPFETGSFENAMFETNENGFAYMNGREVYKFATRAMPMAVEKACKKLGITPPDLKWIIPHQANLRIIETAAKNLGLAMEKMIVNIEKYGNTSSASMAICLDELFRSGKLAAGDKLCVVGFGAGLSFGASILEW